MIAKKKASEWLSAFAEASLVGILSVLLAVLAVVAALAPIALIMGLIGLAVWAISTVAGMIGVNVTLPQSLALLVCLVLVSRVISGFRSK